MDKAREEEMKNNSLILKGRGNSMGAGLYAQIRASSQIPYKAMTVVELNEAMEALYFTNNNTSGARQSNADEEASAALERLVILNREKELSENLIADILEIEDLRK